MTELTSWLFEQSAIVIVGGAIIWYLIKIIKDKDKEIKRLNNEVKEYAKYYRESAKEFNGMMAIIKEIIK